MEMIKNTDIFEPNLKYPEDFINRLLKKASTALITQIRKNDYTDISMGFNL